MALDAGTAGLLGAGIVLVGGLINKALDTRNESNKLIREQRLKAYADVLATSDEHFLAMAIHHAPTHPTHRAFIAAQGRAFLVASKAAREALNTVGVFFDEMDSTLSKEELVKQWLAVHDPATKVLREDIAKRPRW